MKLMNGTVLVLAACTASSLSAQTTRSVRGDTTNIISRGAGVWGPAQHTAIEVLRLDGQKVRTVIGDVVGFTALANGGVAVFDGRGSTGGPELKVIDSSGAVVQFLGRKGDGPSAYGEWAAYGNLAEDSA